MSFESSRDITLGELLAGGGMVVHIRPDGSEWAWTVHLRGNVRISGWSRRHITAYRDATAAAVDWLAARESVDESLADRVIK